MRPNDRVRLGMVGGGQGAFIGAVHRIAARLDDAYSLVCGALSSDAERARTSGIDLGLDLARSYGSYAEMFAAERNRPDGMEVAAIVTPNHLHYPVACAALAAGFHVICDKPLATSTAEADELVRPAPKPDDIRGHLQLFRPPDGGAVARDDGARGLAHCGWCRWNMRKPGSPEIGPTDKSRRLWEPIRHNCPGAIGDIGSHAFHLACFITGGVPVQVLGDLSTFVPGRRVDDNAHVLLRFADGARGMLWASQVAHGHENALRLRVYGESGGLEWAQEEPDRLWFTPRISRGVPEARRRWHGCGRGAIARLPRHEGYLEGSATIYAEVAWAVGRGARRHRCSPGGDVSRHRWSARRSFIAASTVLAEGGHWSIYDRTASGIAR
jgi:predicted dehydrogenase